MSSTIDAAKDVGAAVVKYTGRYCDLLGMLKSKVNTWGLCGYANKIGLECHAEHGLSFETVKDIASIHSVVELNIGHFLMGESIIVGIDSAIKRMRALMDEARFKREPI